MGQTNRHFESEACSRCGGSGRHSFNGRHSICYKCGGAKYTLTKAGAAARAAWLAANCDDITVADLAVGDTVRTGYFTLADLLAGGGGRDILAKVTAIETGEPGDFGWHSVDGVRVDYTHCWTAAGIRHPSPADAKVIRWTLRLPLPPEMEPGTPRKAEMRAFAQAAA